MVFKQKAMAYLRFGVLAIFVGFLVCSARIIRLHRENIFEVILLILPLAILTYTCIARLEWFYIYQDRIEARSVFGIRNVVYFCDVIMIQEKLLGLKVSFSYYFFIDHRKTHKKDGQKCEITGTEKGSPNAFNTKKYCLRIHKTPRLEEFMKNHPALKDLPIKEIPK